MSLDPTTKRPQCSTQSLDTLQNYENRVFECNKCCFLYSAYNTRGVLTYNHSSTATYFCKDSCVFKRDKLAQYPICPQCDIQDKQCLKNQQHSAFECGYCFREYVVLNNKGVLIYTDDTTAAAFKSYVKT